MDTLGGTDRHLTFLVDTIHRIGLHSALTHTILHFPFEGPEDWADDMLESGQWVPHLAATARRAFDNDCLELVTDSLSTPDAWDAAELEIARGAARKALSAMDANPAYREDALWFALVLYLLRSTIDASDGPEADFWRDVLPSGI